MKVIRDKQLEPGADDLSSIRSDFIDMVGELDTLYRTLEDQVAIKSRELVRAERLASVGYLAAGIAHEINNPLNAISGYSEMVSKQLVREDNSERWEDAVHSLDVIHREAMRCKAITDRLLSLSRKSPEARGPVDLGIIAEQTITLIAGLAHLANRKISNHLRPEDRLIVWGSQAELTQVFLNILVNAIESCEINAGCVEVRSRRLDNYAIEISISDNGHGMTPEVLKHLFEPFFTRKLGQQAAGTGLGMSIVHAITRDYGGLVHAQSDGPGQGSVVTLTLPAYSNTEKEHAL